MQNIAQWHVPQDDGCSWTDVKLSSRSSIVLGISLKEGVNIYPDAKEGGSTLGFIYAVLRVYLGSHIEDCCPPAYPWNIT